MALKTSKKHSYFPFLSPDLPISVNDSNYPLFKPKNPAITDSSLSLISHSVPPIIYNSKIFSNLFTFSNPHYHPLVQEPCSTFFSFVLQYLSNSISRDKATRVNPLKICVRLSN